MTATVRIAKNDKRKVTTFRTGSKLPPQRDTLYTLYGEEVKKG